jgi:hypothetical protein
MKMMVPVEESDRSFAGVMLNFLCNPMWNETLKRVQGDKYRFL